MATHAPTGPGKIALQSPVPTGGVRAVMSNYDIDSDVLKPEHQAFLSTQVAPILAGRRARLFMQGSASSTGTAAHNIRLTLMDDAPQGSASPQRARVGESPTADAVAGFSPFFPSFFFPGSLGVRERRRAECSRRLLGAGRHRSPADPP